MDIYKVHCLDANGVLEKVYVFSGGNRFSTPEEKFAELGVPIIYSPQQIHKDDSIRVIKNKIVQAIGANIISYNELYLFMEVNRRLDMMNVYQQITNNWRTDFTKSHLVQLLHNLGITPVNIVDDRHIYTYEEVLGIVGNDYRVKIPLGQKFSKEQDYLFAVDPYTINNEILYQPTKKNILTVFDNMLLLNWGSPIDNVITVCFAENVLNHIQSKPNADELEPVIIQTYFPFLHLEDHIETVEQLMDKKENILKKSRANTDKNAFEYYKTIDMFYDVFHKRTSDLRYVERGIQSFSIMIDTRLNAKLPLEIVFKNIHATETIPFIKYNPGSMRENLYRLFVNKISKNGKKIPKLSEQEIMRLARFLGKGNQISMAVKMPTLSEDIYIDFLETGNIRVYGDLNTSVLPEELKAYISSAVNPVIDTINEFLQKSGYKLRAFEDLHQENVQVLNMKYVARMLISEELNNLQKYIKCLSSLFVIYQPNISKVAKMVFKRVENFKEMDAKTIFIQSLYQKTDNSELIIKGIMDNFQITNEEATKVFGKYLETVAAQQDLGEEVIDVPGFQTLIYNDKEENHIVIEVDNIVNIEYIKILHMYIDSFLRITQHPTTTEVDKSDIDGICKTAAKMKADVDKSHIQNQVVAIAPVSVAVMEEVGNGDMDDDMEDIIGEPVDELVAAIGKEPGQKGDDFFKDANRDDLEEDDDDALFYGEDDEEEADELFKGGGRKKKAQNIITNDILLNDLLDQGEAIEQGPPAPGAGTLEPYRVGLAGVSLHNPNVAERRMQKREPFLFTAKSGKFTNYSTLCQSAAKKQPIILTDEEKAKIDENDAKYGKGSRSYQHAIKYGTNPDKKFWYICPRYWCLQTNMSMTEEEVRAGKCAAPGTKYPDNIIPDDEEFVPEGAYVIEFKSQKHVKSDGSYDYHNPAVLTKKTADGNCLPCCYSGWRTGLWDKHMETCPEAEPDDADNPVDKQGKPIKEKGERKAKPAKSENYIVGIDKINIGPGRWGLLPFSVQAFLHEDNNKCIAKSEEMEKPVFNKEDICLLRYGVEKNDKQSFLGCVAVMYAHKHNLPKTPSIKEMKNILISSLNLDHFVHSYNGSLISTFKPAKIDIGELDYNIPSIANSVFYNEIVNNYGSKSEGVRGNSREQSSSEFDMADEKQMDLLNDIIAAFENFLAFLEDDTIEIDYTYLWDIVTEPDDTLMPGGYNLVILEMPKDDLRDNMQIVCPTHSSSNVLYDPAKETALLLKQSNKEGTYYELICGYAKKEINIVRAFREDNTPSNIKYVLNIIQKTTNKYCAPLPGLPKQYDFKKNIDALEIGKILKSVSYLIDAQVLNFQGKVVGLFVRKNDTTEVLPGIYIPTYPSAPIPHIPEKWMDDDDLWQDYETTRDYLVNVHRETAGKILCLPKMKMLDDGLIAGIITETNQFVPISPISENIFDDGIIEVNNHNYLAKEGEDISRIMDNINQVSYLAADNAITTSQVGDNERQSIISKIDLETRYYTFFRSVIRKLLMDYDNRGIRKEIMDILDNGELTYKEKLGNMISALHDLVGGRIEFANINERDIGDIERQCMNMSGKGKIVCFADEESGVIMIPNKHLLGSEVPNETIYYGRMAYELIRYTRIKLFMLSSTAYLTIGNSEYIIYDNEMLILQSLLNADYFKDIVEFNDNKYLKNIDYQNAIPLFSQKYKSQPITVAEQHKLDETASEPGELINLEFVKEKLKNVQGHPTKSLWGRLFHNSSEEYKFYATPRSSFYMLTYILNKVLIDLGELVEIPSMDYVKDILLRAYSGYLEKPGYREKIMSILNIQGKGKLFRGNATFEQVVKSENYYVTDLDIWMLANALSLPIVLFSSTSLKSLFYEKIDWLVMGGNPQTQPYYFIRSPTKVAEMEYQLILPGVKLTAPQMTHFYSLYQTESIRKSSLHLQTLDEYLAIYKPGPKKLNA
uniref:Uncharacterized protein n=1 Tax=viral metagenome TaxID=1070528 RepID=A0A6C0K049_9ZZZZ